MVEKQTSLIVGDIGNTSLRFGEFTPSVLRASDTPSSSPAIPQQKQLPLCERLPQPHRTFSSSWKEFELAALEAWLDECTDRPRRGWRLGSVNRVALDTLSTWIDARQEPLDVITYEHFFDFPLQVQEPSKVGIDRIAAAFAANRLREPLQAAIVIDTGTAITIDCVTPAGEFLGGAISPGMQLGLDSLSSGTDQLPQVQLTSTPPLIGKHTMEAIQTGVYWMTVHGINGFISALRHELAAPCRILATGGAMKLLQPDLHADVLFLPDLVLAGLALAQP